MRGTVKRYSWRLSRIIAATVIGVAASRDVDVALAAANHPPVAGFGTALSFDGVNDYVQIADANDLDVTNNYTLECWFKADGFGGLRGLIGKYHTSGANGYVLRLNGANFDFDQMTTSGLNLQTGRWYHVAAVNSNGTRTLYLNGIAQTLGGTPLTVQANTNPVCLGADYLVENNRFFAGMLDEVRIWKQALSGAVVSNWMYREVDPTHPAAANLVAYYKLNDGTGTSAADSAGTHAGMLKNMSGTVWTDSTVGRQYAVTAGQSVSGQLPGSDVDGASSNGANWALTFEIVNPGACGTATVVSANTFTYSASLVADTVDRFTYRVLDSSNAVSNVSTVLVSVASPPPYVDITNANESVSAYTTTYSLGGTNNAWVVGAMLWTNAANASSGTFPATSSWTASDIALVFGDNVIAVFGTNYAGVAASDTVTIKRHTDAGDGSPLHYVCTNSPAPAWPYTNWVTAAHTIQDAVDAAWTHDTVLVTNGVYAAGGAVTPGASLSNRVCVTKGITLQSINGPDSTFIVGATAVRCVFIDSGATVSGFMLTNGAAIDARDVRDNAGGGVFLAGGTLTNCIVTGNRALATIEIGIGGGILAEGGTINNCVISGNTASFYGGGIYGSPTMNNCILRDNSAQLGGALSLGGGQVNNCLLTGNYANEEASAVHAFGGEINHCTIVANVYGRNDVGCVWIDDGSVIIRNSIIANNLGGNVEIWGGGSGTFIHCCAKGLSGDGNITSDPQFVNAPEGDYRLCSSSPCVDSGTNGYSTGSSLDGGARVVKGVVDMGAYEFQRLVSITNPPGAISVACTTAVYTISGTNTPSLAGNLSWTNPATGATGSVASVNGTWQIANIPLGPGDNRIQVSGVDTAGRAVCDAVLINRAARDPGNSPIHYVSADSATPTWPFTNWSTAARTIQDAVDTANTNDTVLVSNGVYSAGGAVTPGYTLMNRLCITNPVTVRAVGGPTVTFIVGATDAAHPGSPRSVRCAYLTAGTTLEGFTLMNGDTSAYGNRIREASGGGAILQNGGTLNNCVISGCWSRGTGTSGATGGGGVFCDGGGMLNNCVVKSNSAAYNSGGVFCYNGGLLVNSLLVGNSAHSDGGGACCYNAGALSNCTVSGNSAYSGSGIAFYSGGRLHNTIVYYNQGPGSDISGSGTSAYSCSPGLSGGGNIGGDPKFINASAGNYRLLASSPCVNVGANASWMTNASDLDGNPRLFGGTVDMGAYEYAPPAVAITNTVTTVPATQTTVILGGTNNTSVTGTMVYTNAATGASGSFPAQTPWLSPAIALIYGMNTITVTGTNSVGAAASSVITITRPPLVTYVAPGGSNVWPYATWADAATTIQAAVDAVSTNGTVWVTNGVYAAGGSVTPGCALSNRVSLTKAITLQSVNGAAVTVIVGAAHPTTTNGTSAIRCVWMNAGALVGFTLTNGHTFATGGNWNHDVAGGGLNLSGSATASNCVIAGCSAAHGGGVKFVGAGTLEKCTVQNCRSDGQGGGLYFNVGGTISRCIVRNNRTSSDNGGGAYLYRGGLVRSSLFALNTAASSGGGALMDTGGLLENCTVVSNTCPGSGGGVYVWQSGTNLNTILQYNTATGTTSNYTAGASGVFRYCCTTPLVTGTGNIIAAPLFVGGGDYRLQTGSPCINTGTNQTWMGTATDLAGLPRVLDTYADMGAYEYAGAPVVDITTANANVSSATTNTTIAGTANAWVVGMLAWTNPAAAVGGTWPASASWSISGVPLAPGLNTITVSGTNVAGTAASDTVTLTRDPNAGPGSPVHYVALDSPAAAWPYTNWTSAAHTLQDAVDTADTGDTVLVTNGVYSVGGKVIPGKTLLNRVFITANLTVQSVNGPTNTFIVGAGPRGASAVRGAYLSAGVLSGFTLTNGNTRASATPDWLFERSGGGAFFNNGGSLSNCIVTGSSATEGGGGLFLYQNGVLNNCTIQGNSSFGGSEGLGGGGVYIADSGTLNHCLISGNTATKVTGNGGMGGGVMVQNGGTLNNCIISNNSSSINGAGGIFLAAGGRLNNSTICHNTTSGSGGGVQLEFNGAVNNCLVYANSAGDQGGGAYLFNGGALNNCTLAGNTSQADGGGAYLFEGGTLNNCIVYGNTQAGAWNIGVFGAGSTVRYTCSSGLSGSGNITNNPAFVNAAANNYRLSAGSPCINAGNNAYAQGATDLDGTPRIIGGTVDMGAYESTSGSTANGIPWSWLLQYGLATDGSADHQQADADTFDNLQEYIADLNPTNAASYFRITDISNSPTTTVSFVSSAGRAYTLIGVTNLSSSAWLPVPGAGPRLGTGGADALSDTNVPPKGPFYKLQVELP